MQVERVLAEIKSVRQKYSQAIFELERCKDNVKKLETDKELVSKILKEARDKIDLLESENEKLRNEIANCTSKQTNTVAKKTPREVRSLLAHNSVLEARLKQAEFGVRQKKTFRRDDTDCSNEKKDFEVEEILAHKVSRGKKSFLIRWSLI